MSDPVASMIANLEANTGQSLEWWVEQARSSGKKKHGEVVTFLKTEHGLGHGYANLVAITLRDQLAGGPASDDQLVTEQYGGKESLVPIYESLIEAVTNLGPDVEIAPKKASVSLRRSKQFALIEPATRSRIDLGLNLKDRAGTDRLKVTGGMCTHKVGLTTLEEVDDELLDWLREAYEIA